MRVMRCLFKHLIFPNSLVTADSFYASFTNCIQKIPIPHLTRPMKQKFLHKRKLSSVFINCRGVPVQWAHGHVPTQYFEIYVAVHPQFRRPC